MAGTAALGTMQLHRPCPSRGAGLPRPAAPCVLQLRSQPAATQHTGISFASLQLSVWQHRHSVVLEKMNKQLCATGLALAGGFQCAAPSTRCSHVVAAAAVEGALALALSALCTASSKPTVVFYLLEPLTSTC